MELYLVDGIMTYNEAGAEDGFENIAVYAEVPAENASDALDVFLCENPGVEYWGKLTQYDADTRGKKWAEFYDQNECQRVMVTLVEQELV
jgi:hypothetical protein